MKIKKIIAWLFIFSLYSLLCWFLADITADEYGGKLIYWIAFFGIFLAGTLSLILWAVMTIVETS
jgi:hypothetical protein